LEAIFMHVPGLLVATPSTPADAKGLLKAAIRDENPVIFIEHESLYGQRGEVPDGEEHLVDFGRAVVRREGTDVTIVGISRMAITAEQAAQTLADEHGVQAEVIDPRTLRPLDLDTVLRSVAKTNRCVVVEEGWPHGGVGANLAALIAEQAFDDLDAPVRRVTGADVPMPYSKPLEEIAFPHEPQVVHAALEVLGLNPGDTRLRRWPIRGCERSECLPDRSPFQPAPAQGDAAGATNGVGTVGDDADGGSGTAAGQATTR
jgi:pyruvate dehydrogenase E1 component beta subunit